MDANQAIGLIGTVSPLIIIAIIGLVIYAISATGTQDGPRDKAYVKMSDAYFRRMFVPPCITFCVALFVLAIIFDVPGTSRNAFGMLASPYQIKF